MGRRSPKHHTKMIVVKLKGGMGNQMFQYALGRRLSHDLNTPLKFDISAYQNQQGKITPRHYALYHFNIIENFATAKEIRRLKYPFWIFSKLGRAFSEKILRRFHVGYEPNILKKRKNIYLDGFWHNEKYFKSIEDILIKEFTLKKPLSPEAEALAKDIKSSADLNSAVAVHVRRGDFANDPATMKYHGLMTTDYYGGAIQLLKSKIGDIKLYVFSDDIEWVKENISFSDLHVYVSRPSIPFHQEIALMSRCSHQIIANSSFSWWGAWLNSNPQKIVIAPTKWLAETGSDYYKEIPESWIKI